MRHKRKLTLEQKRSMEGYVFITPWIIGFATFIAYPFFESLWLSFHKVTEVANLESEWTGWANYINAFIVDINFLPNFIMTVNNTLINTPLIIVFALFIAILLNRDIKLKAFFRAAFFLPVLLGTGFILQQLLGQGVNQQALTRGIAIPEEFFVYLGPTVASYVQGFFDRLTLILWKSGVQIILFLAGLQGISASLYESARCDGASEWEMFWQITLPMISPVILLNIIYTLIDSFTDVSNPIVDYVINVAFRQLNFGYGAALGWIYFIFVFIVVAVIFLISKRFVYYAGDR
ncbi:carbohydrate ABC transporter permease [Mahella australiensis]|uniref:Binding-protein-dependent transport systems inner membrane component n=1 Tax=Mahella australiensis (strain DSM 15567 / CIP 107919 / 50-1 BON) TaxID=697281 RepID=F3ZV99_MAHA5|nr:sugar ABC transporter permease [Mahella australiensis]AEE95249.1 binding-protein-dependent transport systems inner membrane component [Mahella australiensis 50-1 BON]